MNNTNTLGKFRIISVRADGKVEQEQTLDFRNQRGDQPIRMQTAKGLKYRLVDVSKQGDAGPDEIQVRRVGKDLHIALDDGGQTDVVLENYYDNATQSQDGLYGLTQDGENYSYVPQDPQENGLIDLLPNDGEWVEAALGSYQVSGAGAAVAVLAFNPLLAAAGAGVAAAAAVGGGGNGPSTVPATPSAAPTSYKDDIGTVQNAASTATVTDDNKPGLNVPAGLSGTVNLYVDGVKVASTYDSATGTLTPTAAVADGSHTFAYSLSDAAGNESGRSAALTFTVDTTAPNAPAAVVATDDVGAIQGTIAAGGVTDDTKPTFSGTGTAGDVVKVYDGNTVIGSATVAPDGTWSVTPPAALGEGAHNITTTATDAAGNESGQSPAVTLNVDTTAPAAPTAAPTSYKDDIGTVQNAASTANVTDDNKPGINVPTGLSGTVNLYIDGVKVAATYDSATGTLTPTAAVADGSHTFAYSLSDAAGNESGRSAALTFTVDTTAPNAPAAVVATDDVGAIRGNIANNGVTDDALPTFSGTGTAGDVVKVYDGNTVIGSATVAPDGTWSVTPPAALAEGTHNIATTVTDPMGNESGRSPVLTFTVDTTAPNAPAAVVATDDVGDSKGEILNDGFTDNTKPTFSGTGTAGDLIKVYDGNTVMGSVTVAAGGTWSFTPATPLTEGLHSITSTATDAAGNESPKSTALSFTAQNVLSISIPEALDGVNASEAANGVQVSINLPDVVFINDSVTLLVTRPDKSTYELGKKVTELNFQTKRMEFTVPDKQEGQYSLKATISGSSVEKSSAIENFTIDTTPTSNATVGLGVNLSNDANNDGWVNASEQGSASNFTSRATFNANAVAGDKVVFTAYYNGVALVNQTVTLTATDIANKYVNASFTKSAEGATLTVTANYMDAAGNPAADSIPSDSAKLDTIAPGAPSVHGVILSSQYSAADVPMYVELPSNAAVGDKVTVTMTNTVISTGARSVAYTTTLTVTAQDLAAGQIGYSVPGSYFSKAATTEFTASMVDVAGNVSVLGYAAPAAPSVEVALVDSDFDAFYTNDGQIMPDATRAENTDVADLYDYATIDKTLEFQGNANANDTVYLYENGVQIGVASNLGVSDQGIQAWGFSGTFAVGDHAITAKSVNAAGVVSDQSVVFTFSIQEGLDIPDLGLLTGSSYSVANGTPERLTLQAQDVLDLDLTLTVLGDVSDTLVVYGAQQVSAYFSEAQLGIDNEYVQHIPGTNGQSGFWQIDLDGSGTTDLMVSDTVHRIILSA